MTNHENFTPSLVEKLQLEGVELVAYTVNSATILKKLKNMGIRFVMTDELKKLKKALEN